MSGTKKSLLLFFTCVRSGPCRRMESVLDQVARKERHRIDVVRVDVDEQPELARRLQVPDAPALVLAVDRTVVARLEGRVSATKIEAFLEAHLGVATTS